MSTFIPLKSRRSAASLLLVATVILATGLFMHNSRSAVLFEQPLNTAPEGFFSSLGGQLGADQFALGDVSAVEKALWFGIYNNVDLDPIPTFLNFTVTMYTNASGLPGAEIFSQTSPARVTDSGSVVTEPGPRFGRAIYMFEMDFASDLVTPAATTRWISIAEVDSLTPPDAFTSWLWSFAESNQEDTKAYRGNNGIWSVSDNLGNLAFSLEGAIVPIPAAIWLFASALCLIPVVGVNNSILQPVYQSKFETDIGS